MRNNRILAIIAFLPILIGLPALSQAQQKLHWTSTNGPYQPLTGNVNFFEADGHIFGDGVQSSDDGLTWMPFYDKALSWQINGQSLQVDSQGHLFGQFFGGYFYLSSDSGITWSDSFPSLQGKTVDYRLVIDGRGRLLAQSYGDDTLFWTSNFGVTWNSVSPYQYPPATLITAGTGDNLFAWPYDSVTQPYLAYFFHSENLMQTRQRVTVDSGRRSILNPVTWINDTSIWVRTDSGLFISKDSGNHFAATGTGIHGTRIYFFWWFNDSSVWIATDSGLFTSRNRAQTFTFSGISGKYIQSVARGATNATILVAANDSAFISHDDGASWQPLHFQLNYSPSAEFFTSSKGTLFLSNSNGAVWTSRDNGYTWAEEAQRYSSVHNLYSCQDDLWGTTPSNNAPSGEELQFSYNDGDSWQTSGLPYYTDYSNFLSDGSIVLQVDSSIELSTNRGVTWKHILEIRNNNRNTELTTFGDTIIVGVDSGILVSTSHGETWDTSYHLLSGLDSSNGQWLCYPEHFEITPSGVLWVVLYEEYGTGGFFVSYDFGKTLLNRQFPPYSKYNELFLHSIKGETYIQSTLYSLIRTTDDGITWVTLSGIPHDEVVKMLEVRTDLYLVLRDSGISISTDSGLSWAFVNDGFEDRQIYCLANLADTLFAGTDGGVYIAKMSAPSSASSPMQSNDLMSVYPNPSGKSITVSVTLQQPGPIELQLTDTKGTVLQRLSSLQSENAKDYIFNLSTLPDGVYFVSLSRAGQPGLTEKIVKH